MKIDTKEINPAFQSIIQNPGQTVFLDANFFIPPDRSDSELSSSEMALMNHYITKIAVHSQYDPYRDNAKDRGEVRSLSFMAVKKFLYFAVNDALPVRLVKNADKLNTGLYDMGIVQMYELIYFLHMAGKYDNKGLRALYKYQYYLSPGDKRDNPEWGIFIEQMDKLYGGLFVKRQEKSR